MSYGPKILREYSHLSMCHMSHDTCHMSRVTCRVSHDFMLWFFYKVVELVGGGSVINRALGAINRNQICGFQACRRAPSLSYCWHCQGYQKSPILYFMSKQAHTNQKSPYWTAPRHRCCSGGLLEATPDSLYPVYQDNKGKSGPGQGGQTDKLGTDIHRDV